MYSRNSIIRATYTGGEIKSTANRLVRHRNILNLQSKSIHVISLQGFVFFGTLYQLDAYIHHIIENVRKLSYVIMDFTAIDGIDYSATGALIKIKRLAKENEIHLLLCGMQDESFLKIEKSGICDTIDDENVNISTESSGSNLIVFGTLDNALEWCENNILETCLLLEDTELCKPLSFDIAYYR